MMSSSQSRLRAVSRRLIMQIEQVDSVPAPSSCMTENAIISSEGLHKAMEIVQIITQKMHSEKQEKRMLW